MNAENPQFSQRISRRKILEAGIGLAILAKLGLPKFDPERPDYDGIPPVTLERLREFKFQTVAHNGANGRYYDEYAKTGCNFIEADVSRHHGQVYVGHEKFRRGIGIDTSQKSITISWPRTKFETVIARIKRDGYKAYIDFKDSDSVIPVLDLIRQKEMQDKALFTSESWAGLNRVRDLQEGECSNLFYTISSQRNLETFLSYKEFPQVSFGTSLDQKVASEENIILLKDKGASSVFVYSIESAQNALRVLENGADGIITNNISLLNLNSSAA